ncbi:bifunctional phosphopantothenoylcysteine decarboxylase/phosphopantothenate--cysteine ligase CoaBC [Mariprofundus erugo]|uniref:bifunctional phosphopantothenoylcysteine decarboxylase/phosphopantothenate--cysteine ligase CoaBC n=1 Tax=Mariprofundus erugo TaxID=2528639 RepID=UPI001EE86C6A|nr:bifunctional phosphopantothenoylcysteine decarboxylase/phosphopantothenate--cysteine ligase CoaBC [Mariprofundus erugo]
MATPIPLMLCNKRILLGIGGGIAAYRVAELARLLVKQGAEVRCVMTRSACEFVTPLTFEALTGNSVHTRLFDLVGDNASMGHIELARWADAIIIAPATAGVLARIAHGIADDLLSTIMLVSEAPVLLAPAMNHSMWSNAATRHNTALLRERGMHITGPAAGMLACGEEGAGRLSEPEDILAALLPLLTPPALAGQRWVINAGPTAEAWDGVRILTNRASGTLGALLASQAAIMGARVTLIAGPGTPATITDVERIPVESADAMLAACLQAAAGATVFVGTAAVSDFRFTRPVSGKIKRGSTGQMVVELTANPDIIATIAHMHDRPCRVIAFAAEAEKHIEHGRKKLAAKGVDAIVANDISNMGSHAGGGWWLTPDHEAELHSSSKQAFADAIIHQIMKLEE